MNYSKTKDVKTPEYATEGSAGMDFFVPNDFGIFTLYPQQGILIDSGIYLEVPKFHQFTAFNRSGLASKHKIIVGACLVDSDYQGELRINILNVGDEPFDIKAGDKITQFVLSKFERAELNHVDFKDLHKVKTQRGDGGFGSSDKNR